MTREEAIQNLKYVRDGFIEWCGLNDVGLETFRMAIAALEQPVPCEDAVSRKDVEVEIANLLRHVFVEYQDIAKKSASKLPSVTPKLPDVPDANVGECEDAVNREAVLHKIDVLKKSEDGMLAPEDIAIAVTYLPSVTPKPKMGKWLEGHRPRFDGTRYWYRYCSECEYERSDYDPRKDTKFCPGCGAAMAEGADVESVEG